MADIQNLKKVIYAAAACLAAAALIWLVVFDVLKTRETVSNTSFAMGTTVIQSLRGPGSSATAGVIVDKIGSLEEKSLSWRQAGSDIYRINANAGSSVRTGADTAEWVRQCLKISAAGAGAFDITVGSLSAFWDIGGENPRVPAKEKIAELLKTIDRNTVKTNGDTVKIAAGQRLDMGAVGKGIACDEARKILEKSRVKTGTVSVGGSVLVYGYKKGCKVGIRDPKGTANDYMGILNLGSCCVSTSGNYEKTFTFKGKTYHHILDPKTGYPADSGLTSVTVVCDSGLASDALSTACFVLGYENSLPLLEQYSAGAVFIGRDGTVKVTADLEDRFSLNDSAGYVLEPRV